MICQCIFANCYENKNKTNSFEQWIKKVETTSLREMKIAAETIKRNLGGIKNYFHNRATNAAIESFHSKLKLFRQRIRGVVDKDYFFSESSNTLLDIFCHLFIR
ncbi:MAG: transposase [Melioribacteraceae bacterium]|nr:transposase [Melioribacteraceae bacterium]